MAWTISTRLQAACAMTAATAEWLDGVPDTINELAQQWQLRIGAPLDDENASCAWVARATRADGTHAVFKLAMPHFEGQHESEGLRFWAGNPTVRLLESDDARGAMLLERCEPGTPLSALPEPVQDLEIAILLRRLWRSPPPHHPFRRLSELLTHWGNEALVLRDQWHDPTLVGEGLALFHELSRSGSDHVLLATDLHAGNVLRAERERWLVIDPKPFVGDPAFDATQHLLNCRARLHSHPHATIWRFADLLQVNPETVHRWTFARLAIESVSESAPHEAEALARSLAP